MATIIDEHTQWVDSGGRPLADGELYIGIAGSDPVANPKTIYSDSALTTPALNPQPLDADGRTENKLYVDGEYSIQANDVNGTQQYQSLEAGSAADDVPIVGLTSVSGGDTIVASGGITAYIDKAIYSLTVAQVNTGPVTLNIDSVGAKSVFKNLNEELDAGDWQEDQNVNVQYNATTDDMHWINQTVNLLESGGAMTGTLSLAKGADVASAATLTLGTDGNYFDITGTTGITAIATIGVGTVVRLHFDDALILTHNATDLVLPGGANITTAAGDEATFVEYATGDWRCTEYQRAASGPGILRPVLASKTDTFTTTSNTWTAITGLNVTITPTSTNSQILLMAMINGSANNTLAGGMLRIYNGTAAVVEGDSDGGNRTEAMAPISLGGNNVNDTTSTSLLYIDSPNTTSAITYTAQIISPQSATLYINRSPSDGNSNFLGRYVSTLVAIEIFA